jgi:hypothetical protein
MSTDVSGSPTGTADMASSLGSDYRRQLAVELEPARLLRFVVIFLEFALVVAAIRLLNIESNSFESVLTLALGGFVVNHFLPAQWRHTFFAGLSLASVLLVFGVLQGAWLLILGVVLIALCHLPVPFRVRIVLVLLAATAMAFERVGMIPIGPSVPGTIWPILGAMFMFRLFTYMYDLAHKSAPFSPVRAVSYFFMLPNVCFPLFPVVDYKTLQRSIYNDDALKLYQTGVKWMLRGVVHLALYKVVYFLAVVDPSEVVTGTGAARYMVSTYLLYLKISGLFHLIIGLLRMFGFGLPETHHFYLFASSFTDFWRRINIYWKDFIQKLVFNPIYFATRKLGATGSLVVATLVAFTATWLFHSYQWFWIRGTFPIVWSDLVFWFGLGVVVMFNVLIETRFGRRRSLGGKDVRSMQQDVIHGLKIAGTFAAICILWTIWSTPEMGDLGFIWRAVMASSPADIAVLVGIPLLVGALGLLFGGRQREGARKSPIAEAKKDPFWREVAMTTFGATAFILIALKPALLTPISPQLSGLVQDVGARASLNTADAERLRRGYYEDLTDVNRFNAELWQVMGDAPPGWMVVADQLQYRTDAIRIELVPSTTAAFKGATRTINSHGMRDREYTLVPGPNTFRIILFGSSHDMGHGVEDNETYENLVEDRLNAELGPVTGLTYEILNLSLSAYTPVQKLEILRVKALEFEPDLIIYSAASNELNWVFRPVQLRWLAENNFLEQFPSILVAMNRAGVSTNIEEFDSNDDATTARLMPYAEEVFTKLFTRFRDLGETQDVQTALLLLEVPDDTSQSLTAFDQLNEIGEGLSVPVLNLRGAFSEISDRSTLWIAPFDTHTNAHGHQMIADLLFEQLLSNGLVPILEPLVE